VCDHLGDKPTGRQSTGRKEIGRVKFGVKFIVLSPCRRPIIVAQMIGCSRKSSRNVAGTAMTFAISLTDTDSQV